MLVDHMRRRIRLALWLVLAPVGVVPLLGILPNSTTLPTLVVALAAFVAGTVLAVRAAFEAVRSKSSVTWVQLSPPFAVLLGYSVLAAWIARTIRVHREEVRPYTVDVQLVDIAKGIELYWVKVGVYPNHLTDLETHHPRPVIERIPEDPWSHPYRYVLRADTYELCSDGADGLAATADDKCVSGPRTSTSSRVSREPR